MKNNVATAIAGGMKEIDLVFNPCVPLEPDVQAKEFINAINGLTVDTIWINVDVPGWREFKNFNVLFMEDLLVELSKSGKKVGVLSSKFKWEDNFGASFNGAADKPLMYESLNNDPSYKDFKPFGGWTKPSGKHFQSGAKVCSMVVELTAKNQ